MHLRPTCSAHFGGITLIRTKTIGTTYEFFYVPLISLNLTLFNKNYPHKIETIIQNNDNLFYDTKKYPADLNTGMSLQDIENKYEAFLDEKRYDLTDTHPLHLYTSVGSIIFGIILTITLTILCMKHKKPNPQRQTRSTLN